MPIVSILIPAFNEAERIGDTISAVRTLSHIDEIIVIDDGSSDDTSLRAEAAGADTVVRQANAGKGAALRAGAAIASGDVLLLLDADLGSSAAEAEKLLTPVRTGSADMTIASFPVIPGKGGGAGLVVRLARWGICRLTGRPVLAPLSGQRAITRKLLGEVGGFADGWGVEIALTVHALWLDFAVMEIPTTMTHRVTGRSFKDRMHRATQFVAAARVLFRLWRSRPAGPRMDARTERR
jgi:glycosyltransferase involved in cell wall biosynthesis